MDGITSLLFSTEVDPLLWTLGPMLLAAQAAVFAAAWQRVHRGDRLDRREILADLAPIAALAGLLLAHPYMVAHPESSMPLVVAYGFLAAVYATIVYGSLGRIPWGRRSSRPGSRSGPRPGRRVAR